MSEGRSFDGRLVVVLAAGRSGSTWLNQLLLAHPRIAGVEEGETAIFHGLADYWLNGQGQWGPGIGKVISEAETLSALKTFCDEAFAARREVHRPMADFFVEKTPNHVYRLPWVARIYPSAWYIHLVRDGRDVIRSTKRMWFGSRFASRDALRWRDAVAFGRVALSKVERGREVRYESLLADPVGATIELFDWMGLETGPEVEAALVRRSGKAVAAYTGERSVGTGKWRQDLSRWQLGQIYWCAGGLLQELGYVDPGELDMWRRRPELWYGGLMARRPEALLDMWERAVRRIRRPGDGRRQDIGG